MRQSNRPKTRLDRLRVHATRWGWPRALLNLVTSGARRYLGIHICAVRVRPIPANPQYSENKPNLEVRRVLPIEIKAACEDPELMLSSSFVDAAIRRGDQVYGAFDGSLLVSYLWRAKGAAPDTGNVWIRVDHPYNYSYNAFTRTSYRGQRISPVVFLFSDNEMYRLGYRYRVGFVNVTNFASLALSKHIGAEIIGYAGYISCFGLFFGFRTSKVRSIGFRFFRPD